MKQELQYFSVKGYIFYFITCHSMQACDAVSWSMFAKIYNLPVVLAGVITGAGWGGGGMYCCCTGG